MRRIDRAIFAIFLLALAADVARSYASTPVSSELSGSLILSAASQFQANNPADAVFSLRRTGSRPSYERRAHRTPVLAIWSKTLLSQSAQWKSAPWSQVALLQPAIAFAQQPLARVKSVPPAPLSALVQIEHAGNPAP